MKLKCYSLSISDICKRYRSRKLVLNPPYQRRPSWRTRQREDLLESIFNGIPIPAVILYKTRAGRRTAVYEVMDGKQRLETILHFRYFRHQGKTIIPGEKKLQFWLRRDNLKLRKRLLFKDLKNSEIRHEYKLGVRLFMNYRVPVIEYSGELAGLAGQKIAQCEVFAKINSTGSKLTKNEIRHARSTPLFHAATRLEQRWYKKIISTWRVFSKAEADRYQYHEMLLELCAIYLHGGISDRRIKLDEFMRLDSLTKSRIGKAERAVQGALVWARRIVGDDAIQHSRLHKKVDFYSFIGTLMELMRHKTVSRDNRQNRAAHKAVMGALNKLGKIDGRVVRYKSLPSRDKKLAEYTVATRESTDQLRNRQIRHDFWYGVLSPCFTKKLASQRLFGKDLKNALWHGAKVQYGRISCLNPERRDDCWGRISYEQAVVDHHKAYVYGHSTSLENGRLLCRVCNSAKGSRRLR